MRNGRLSKEKQKKKKKRNIRTKDEIEADWFPGERVAHAVLRGIGFRSLRATCTSNEGRDDPPSAFKGVRRDDSYVAVRFTGPAGR